LIFLFLDNRLTNFHFLGNLSQFFSLWDLCDEIPTQLGYLFHNVRMDGFYRTSLDTDATETCRVFFLVWFFLYVPYGVSNTNVFDIVVL